MTHREWTRGRGVRVHGCSGRRLWFGALVVAAASCIAYLQTLRFGFIYDDYWTVVGNTHLDKPFAELLRATLSGRSIEWGMPDATRPLMGASLWLDRRAFGLAPWGYHLQSIGLYAAVSAAAFVLAFALLRRFIAALAAGLAFAVLPLHAEVVAAVNYREDLLATLALFASAAVFFWPTRHVPRARAYVCAALWGVALLAKESALALPLLLGALLLVRRPGRWVVGGAPPLALLGAIVAVAWSSWRFGVSALGEQIPRATYPTADAVARTARFELTSVYRSLWPFAAHPEYDPLGQASWLWVPGLAGLLGLALVLGRRKLTRPWAGAVLFALAAPCISSPAFAPINEQADRYWFCGSFAFSLVLGCWVQRVWRSGHGGARQTGAARWAPLGVLAVLCAVAFPSSWSAAQVWSSEVELWTRAVEDAPASPRAWASLSRVQRMAGQPDLAARSIERSLQQRPDYVPAKVARVLNDLAAGQLDRARTRLREIEPETRLNREALRVAARCAAREDVARAQDCVRLAVPSGLVLGDTQRLRVISERLLGPALGARAAGML